MTLDWRNSREEYLWLGALLALSALGFGLASLAGSFVGLPAWKLAYFYMKVIWILGPAALLFIAVPIVLRALVLHIRNPLAGLLLYARDRFGSTALAAGTLDRKSTRLNSSH